MEVQPKQARFSAQGPAAGQGQPVAQPTEATQPVSAPESTTAQQPDTGLSEERMRKILGDEIEKALGSAQRKTQSQIAKMENRIKSTVQQTLATMKAAGMQVSPEQEKALENTIRQQIQPGEQPTEPAQAAAQPAGGDEAPPDPVTAAGWKLMDAYGVSIDENDPEYALLDQTSEAAYLKSILPAIQAKQARIQTPPGARVPAGGGGPAGNPIASIKDTDELWQRARPKR